MQKNDYKDGKRMERKNGKKNMEAVKERKREIK